VTSRLLAGVPADGGRPLSHRSSVNARFLRNPVLTGSARRRIPKFIDFLYRILRRNYIQPELQTTSGNNRQLPSLSTRKLTGGRLRRLASSIHYSGRLWSRLTTRDSLPLIHARRIMIH